MEPKKYATATAFRRALEDRLKFIAAKEKQSIERLRRELAFDRLLARLFAGEKAPWVLKGGYALELRIKEARMTKDIDMSLREALGQDAPLSETLLAALNKAAAVDLADFFVFNIGAAMKDLDGAPYGGARFPVEARMDARTFVQFHIDIGAGDVVISPLDTTEGHDWLAFAGIPAPKFATISREQHLAEKLHAFTVPRPTPNTRYRDLVDMLLLIRSGLDKGKVSAAVAATFKRRATHEPPARLIAPPDSWSAPFGKMAEECGLSKDIKAAFAEIDAFFASLG